MSDQEYMHLLDGFRPDRYRQVMEAIQDHEDQWDQGDWHYVTRDAYETPDNPLLCETAAVPLVYDDELGIKDYCGTSHCFAGWCDVLSGRTAAELVKLEDYAQRDPESFMRRLLNGRCDSKHGLSKAAFLEFLTTGITDAGVLDTATFAGEWLGLSQGDMSSVFSANNTLGGLVVMFYSIVTRRLKWTLEAATKASRADRLTAECWLLHMQAEWPKTLIIAEQLGLGKGPRTDMPLSHYDLAHLARIFQDWPMAALEDRIGGDMGGVARACGLEVERRKTTDNDGPAGAVAPEPTLG